MTLIVEDGTGVASANSYIDLTYLNAFAASRGLTLPASDATKEQYVLRAMDYIESLTFQGSKVASDQSLQWPRSSVVIDETDFAEDAIPTGLMNAVCQLVVEQQSGFALFPVPTVGNKGRVIERTIGPLTTKYSDKEGVISSRSRIVFASVEMYLAKLIFSNVNRTIRV